MSSLFWLLLLSSVLLMILETEDVPVFWVGVLFRGDFLLAFVVPSFLDPYTEESSLWSELSSLKELLVLYFCLPTLASFSARFLGFLTILGLGFFSSSDCGIKLDGCGASSFFKGFAWSGSCCWEGWFSQKVSSWFAMLISIGVFVDSVSAFFLLKNLVLWGLSAEVF